LGTCGTPSHNGVLLLDEVGEFEPLVLDNLRQPLEEGVIRVARAAVAVSQASLGEHAGRHVHVAQRRNEDLVGLHHDATTFKGRGDAVTGPLPPLRVCQIPPLVCAR
jgi:hypothetical protein